ncbi:tyrosine-type recombinase/integrase [Candidatus Woesearchaeota archaeon]|nr:tyrosine-type recombinase/integrase [Candidatus Woesearchaeota archaeon]
MASSALVTGQARVTVIKKKHPKHSNENEVISLFEVMKTELILSNVSKSTIKAYLYQNQKFIDFINKKPEQIKKSDVVEYLLELHTRNNSPRTIRLAIAALNYYYTKILRRNILKHIRQPKIPKNLPRILDKEEIKKMILVTCNQKHRLLISLIYSSGMRVSEALKIRKQDIYQEKNIAIVRSGKGNKDRVVTLSKNFVSDYLDFENSVYDYLFVGQNSKTLTVRTAQEIIAQAAKKAGLSSHAHPHKLRASYATHLLDQGVGIETVASLLGHSSVNTTRNSYIKLSTKRLEQLQNPLDC